MPKFFVSGKIGPKGGIVHNRKNFPTEITLLPREKHKKKNHKKLKERGENVFAIPPPLFQSLQTSQSQTRGHKYTPRLPWFQVAVDQVQIVDEPQGNVGILVC